MCTFSDTIDTVLSYLRFPETTYLQSAPPFILHLGQLVEIASRQDFERYKSFNHTYMPIGRFRLALIEAANFCFDALLWANKDMEQFRLIMGSIPRNVKSCLRNLASASNDDRNASYNKNPFATIKHAVSEGERLAAKTSGNFFESKMLLHRLAETIFTYPLVEDLDTEKVETVATIGLLLADMSIQNLFLKHCIVCIVLQLSLISSPPVPSIIPLNIYISANLLQHFQQVTNVANHSLKPAAKSMTELQQMALKDKYFNLVEWFKESSAKTSIVAKQLIKLSKDYIDVFSEFVVRNIEGVRQLLSTSDMAGLRAELSRLQKESSDTQGGINDICAEHKASFEGT